MMTSDAPFASVHSATAWRTDPAQQVAVPAGSVEDVTGLRLYLVLSPDQYFAVETTASVQVATESGSVALAISLASPFRHLHSPWHSLAGGALSQGMTRFTHAFPAIRGTGEPLEVKVRLRASDQPATYGVGVLSALAVSSAGVTYFPSIGLVAPLPSLARVRVQN